MEDQQLTIQRVTSEDLVALVHRLEPYGSHSALTRTLLLLLHSGVNTLPFKTYTCEATGGSEVVVVTLLDESCRRGHLDVFTRNTAESRRLLCALLRWPELETQLWQRPFLLNAAPLCALDLFRSAAAAHGFSLGSPNEQRMWWRAPEAPPVASLPPPPGVRVGPLRPHHYSTVRRFWYYANADNETVVKDGVKAGLSAGAFVTVEASQHDQRAASSTDTPSALPAERLVSWMVLNASGSLGLLYTEEPYRCRGLARCVLALLSELCEQRALSCCVHTTDDKHSVVNSLSALGYRPGHLVAFIEFEPE